MLVQVIKEGIGTKGPTLSTYLSIPGRILVMMPGMGKLKGQVDAIGCSTTVAAQIAKRAPANTYEQKLVAMRAWPVTSLMTKAQLSQYLEKMQEAYAGRVALTFPETHR